jgi:hypothetical protein
MQQMQRAYTESDEEQSLKDLVGRNKNEPFIVPWMG